MTKDQFNYSVKLFGFGDDPDYWSPHVAFFDGNGESLTYDGKPWREDIPSKLLGDPRRAMRWMDRQEKFAQFFGDGLRRIEASYLKSD